MNSIKRFLFGPSSHRFCQRTGLPLAANGFANPFHAADDKTRRAVRHLVDRNLAHTLACVEVPHIDPTSQKVVTTDFFPTVDRLVMERTPNAKMFVYGGSVRSMLGYIYRKLHAEHMKNPGNMSTKQLLEEFLEETANVKSFDVFGVGSDLDLLWDPANPSESIDTIAPLLKSFIDAYLEKLPKIPLARFFALFGDILEYESQVKRSCAQGGSPLDWLAFPITPRSGDEIRHPNGYPHIIDDFLQGKVRFVQSKEKGVSTKARQLRPLIEFPFLQPHNLHELLQDVRSLSQRSKDTQEIARVLKKAVRNAKGSDVCNYYAVYDPCTHDPLRKELHDFSRTQEFPLIPEFLEACDIANRPPDFDPGNLQRLGCLVDYETFVSTYTDKGILYHGTPDAANVACMLRVGPVVSTEQEGRKQGNAAHGRGFYMTKSYEEASGYAGSDGFCLSLTISPTPSLRILDLRRLPKQVLDRFLQEGKDRDFHEYLQKTYAIDIIINTYVLIQNAAAIQFPKNFEEWGRTILQNYEETLLSLCHKMHTDPGFSAAAFYDYLKQLLLGDSLLTAQGHPGIASHVCEILALHLKNPHKVNPSLLTKFYAAAASQGDASFLQIAKRHAIRNASSKKAEDLESALKFFRAAVEQGQEYADAIEFVQFARKHWTHKISFEFFNLLHALIEKGQGYSCAIDFVLATVHTGNNLTRSADIKLLQALVKKGEAQDLAIRIATNLVDKEKDYSSLSLALDLFSTLVDQGKGQEEAKTAALFLSQTQKDRLIHRQALKLLELL